MSDIFLNPTTGGGGGGEVSYTYLNIWFNSLGATANATPNKLALRNSNAGCSFVDISGLNLRLNASGATEPEISFTDTAGNYDYKIRARDVGGGYNALNIENNNNNGSIDIWAGNTISLKTDSLGGGKTFSFYPTGNVVFPSENIVDIGTLRTNASGSIIKSPIITGNISGTDEPVLSLIDASGNVSYELTTNDASNVPNLYLNNHNQSGIIHIESKDSVLIKTNHGGSSQTFGFYPNGNFIMPSLGTIQAGACNFQGLTSTIGTLEVVNTVNASSSITGANITGNVVNARNGVIQTINNSSSQPFTNITINVSGQYNIGSHGYTTQGRNTISSGNVNITTRPTVELWTQNRSLVNTGTLGGSLTISGGSTANISYGNGFTTNSLDFRSITDNALQLGSEWTISGMANNASSNPALTLSFWFWHNETAWGSNTRNIISIADISNGNGNTAFCLNNQTAITTGPRVFFSPNDGASNDNLTISNGRWNHIVIVNSGGGSQTVYANGSVSFTKSITLALPSTERLTFGFYGSPNQLMARSRYACVRIFPSALSASAVTDLYNERFVNPLIQEAPEVQVEKTLYVGNLSGLEFTTNTNQTLLSGNGNIYASGIVFSQQRPFWNVNPSNNITVAGPIIFDGQAYINNISSTSATNGRITAIVPGFYTYYFSCWGMNIFTAGTVVEAFVRKNGVNIDRSRMYYNQMTSNYWGMAMSTNGIEFLNAGDYLDINFQSTGACASQCSFSGFLL